MGQRWLDSSASQPRRCRVLEGLEEEVILLCPILDRSLACPILAVLRSTNYFYPRSSESQENDFPSRLDLRRYRGQRRHPCLHAELLDHVCSEKEGQAQVEADR